LTDLTISIISHKNRDLLLDCIGSIYRTAGGLSTEVIVVDNCSRDGSVEAVRERFPDVRIIENDHPEGFSANHNKALKAARGEFILILNDDTVLQEGALSAMVGFMRKDSNVGAVGGLLLNPDGTPQYTGKARPTLLAAAMISLGLHRLWPENPVTSGYFMRKEGYGEAEETESINGAAMMVRRDALSRVGLLDEGFFLFCEDVDWSIRFRQAGYKLFFLPGARITHYRGASTGGRRIVWIYHKSLFRFYRKHYAKGRFFLVNWLVYLGIFVRLVVFMAYGNVRKRRPK
jgi:GT2 family glycosyltransferase